MQHKWKRGGTNSSEGTKEMNMYSRKNEKKLNRQKKKGQERESESCNGKQTLNKKKENKTTIKWKNFIRQQK